MTDALATLRSHATCRDYLPDPLPEDELREMIRAAQQCATDATGQLYSLLRVQDRALRDEVVHLIGDQAHVQQAPGLFLVLLDVRRLRLLLEHRGERLGIRPLVSLLFGVTDASLFAQSLVVAAESRGYGTCYLGSVQNHAREIARALALPAGVLPVFGLTMGRPASRGAPKPRLPTDLVYHVDRYRDPSPQDRDRAFATMAAATRSGDWLNPIRKYFAGGGIMEGRETGFHGLLADQGLDPLAGADAARTV